jgi:hypothetical protein
MKRPFIKSLVMMMMLAIAAPSFGNTTEPVRTVNESPEETINRLTKRLEEINAIDKSTLSKSEKRALRGEVKMIKKEMKAVSGGVYISVGAILLIALLLILLL